MLAMTKYYITIIENYFAQRSKLPATASSNQNSNRYFSESDRMLAMLSTQLEYSIRNKQIKCFGSSFFPHKTRSRLLLRCCNCGINPNPFTSKNLLRKSIEDNLINWLKKAKDYINSELCAEKSFNNMEKELRDHKPKEVKFFGRG